MSLPGQRPALAPPRGSLLPSRLRSAHPPWLARYYLFLCFFASYFVSLAPPLPPSPRSSPESPSSHLRRSPGPVSRPHFWLLHLGTSSFNIIPPLHRLDLADPLPPQPDLPRSDESTALNYAKSSLVIARPAMEAVGSAPRQRSVESLKRVCCHHSPHICLPLPSSHLPY